MNIFSKYVNIILTRGKQFKERMNITQTPFFQKMYEYFV